MKRNNMMAKTLSLDDITRRALFLLDKNLGSCQRRFDPIPPGLRGPTILWKDIVFWKPFTHKAINILITPEALAESLETFSDKILAMPMARLANNIKRTILHNNDKKVLVTTELTMPPGNIGTCHGELYNGLFIRGILEYFDVLEEVSAKKILRIDILCKAEETAEKQHEEEVMKPATGFKGWKSSITNGSRDHIAPIEETANVVNTE